MFSFNLLSPLKKIEQQYKKGVNVITNHRLYPRYKTSVTFGQPRIGIDDDIYFVKIENNEYFYGYMERGEETFVESSKDIEDVLYWLFKKYAYPLASDFALSYFQDAETYHYDRRRFIFKRQWDILNLIQSSYALRYHDEISTLLSKYPFKDGYPETLEYIDTYLAEHPEPMPRQSES